MRKANTMVAEIPRIGFVFFSKGEEGRYEARVSSIYNKKISISYTLLF